jgi:hypothetical protein
MSNTANTSFYPELRCPTLSNSPSSASSNPPYGNCQRRQSPLPTPSSNLSRSFSSILYGVPPPLNSGYELQHNNHKVPNYSQQNIIPTHGQRQQKVCMETCTPFLNKSVLKKVDNNPWKEDKIFEVHESNGTIRYEVRDANGKELYRFYEDKKANQEGGKV